MSNRHHSVFYTGVASNLKVRIGEHRSKTYRLSFTSRYNICKLLYYESYHSIEEAIEREKQVKKYSRVKKKCLIDAINPEWTDLYDEIID